MTIIVSDDELANALTLLRDDLNARDTVLHLYKNNITPTVATVLGDFVEADFDGYTPATIDNWDPIGIAAHVATTLPDPVVFTKTAGATTNNIYGYFVTNDLGTILLWSDRDPAAPVAMNSTGAQYTVQTSRGYKNP